MILSTKERPSNARVRDTQFRVGNHFGDMPWFMELYALYLSEWMADGPRMPTDEEMNLHFGFFWSRVLAYFKMRQSDVPVPVWAVVQPDATWEA